MADHSNDISQTKLLVDNIKNKLDKNGLELTKSLVSLLVEIYMSSDIYRDMSLEEFVVNYARNRPEDIETAEGYIRNKKQIFFAYEEQTEIEQKKSEKEELLRNKVLSVEMDSDMTKRGLESVALVFYRAVAEYLWFKKKGFGGSPIEEKEKEISGIIKFIRYVIPIEHLKQIIDLSIVNKMEELESLFLLFLGIELLKGTTKNPQKTEKSVIFPISAMMAVLNDPKLDMIREVKKNLDSDYRGKEEEIEEHISRKLNHQMIIEFEELVSPFIDQLSTLRSHLNSSLDKVSQFMVNNPKAMKKEMYPMLKDLGLIYVNLGSIYLKLKSFVDRLEIGKTGSQNFSNRPVMENNYLTDYELYDDVLKGKFNNYTLISLKELEGVDELHIAYNGYDLVELTENGNITLGQLSVGLLYDTNLNSHLLFRSIANLEKYIANKRSHIERFNELLKTNISLYFLYYKDKLQKLMCYQVSLLPLDSEKQTTKQDISVQTPLHFEEFSIDHGYFWNEWDLRRMTLQMVNIRNKETVGCQTDISLFKVHNNTQIWPLVDSSTMTGIEAGTNPVWPKNYITALRNKN